MLHQNFVHAAGDLTSCRQKPVALDCPNKLVYSPHVWGPSICNQTYFAAKNFPANMADIWTSEWAHICSTKPLLGPACVIGTLFDFSWIQIWIRAQYLSTFVGPFKASFCAFLREKIQNSMLSEFGLVFNTMARLFYLQVNSGSCIVVVWIAWLKCSIQRRSCISWIWQTRLTHLIIYPEQVDKKDLSGEVGSKALFWVQWYCRWMGRLRSQQLCLQCVAYLHVCFPYEGEALFLGSESCIHCHSFSSSFSGWDHQSLFISASTQNVCSPEWSGRRKSLSVCFPMQWMLAIWRWYSGADLEIHFWPWAQEAENLGIKTRDCAVYLQIGCADNFYWCLNPSSGTSGSRLPVTFMISSL